MAALLLSIPYLRHPVQPGILDLHVNSNTQALTTTPLPPLTLSAIIPPLHYPSSISTAISSL